MKTTMKKILSLVMIIAILSTMFVTVNAAGETGSIRVENGANTGIDLVGDGTDSAEFSAYQVLVPGTVTSYEVAEAFKGFFTTSRTLKDGTGADWTFLAGTDMDAYNQNVGEFFDTFIGKEAKLYPVAQALRIYIKAASTLNATGKAAAVNDASGNTQSAEIENLPYGYYFVMDVTSAMNGLGAASTGSFVELKDTTITTFVKNAKPTVDKQIFDEDAGENGDWGNVDDSEIGEKVEFKVVSTLPNNLQYFETYTYVLHDTMSKGLTFNKDVKVYTDAAKENEVTNYTVSEPTTDADGNTSFTVSIDVKAIENYSSITNFYTYYSATVNEDAKMANDGETNFDKNSVKLEYSNEPNGTGTGETAEDTVYHFSFTLDVTKVDEQGGALAGAEFGLFAKNAAGEETQVYLTAHDGKYSPDTTLTSGGTITTGDSGIFNIVGLDDDVLYILREINAPTGYNKANDIQFMLKAEYNDAGEFFDLVITDGNGPDSEGNYTPATTVIEAEGNNSPSTTVVNRKTVALPSTGGVGTTIFQIVGGVLMLAAAAFLIFNQRKKAKASK